MEKVYRAKIMMSEDHLVELKQKYQEIMGQKLRNPASGASTNNGFTAKIMA